MGPTLRPCALATESAGFSLLLGCGSLAPAEGLRPLAGVISSTGVRVGSDPAGVTAA